MSASFQLEKTDDVMATLRVTMRLGEWKKISEQVNNGMWPMCSFAQEINKMIRSAEQTFSARIPTPPPSEG